MTAYVGARARLVEVELRGRRIEIAERRAGDVEPAECNAAAFESGKQRLLPLRMLVQNDEIRVLSSS